MLGRILSALSVAAIAGGVVYAQAAEDAGPSREDLAKARDPAAITTRAEARAYAEWEFFFADADMDGELSDKEFNALATAHLGSRSDDDQHLAERLSEFRDSRSGISKQFFVKMELAAFDKADTDKSQTLEETEKRNFVSLISSGSAA